MKSEQPKAAMGFQCGTFGELVQGELDGIPFLITLPIHWGTRATFVGREEGALEVWPGYRKKAAQAVTLALEEWNLPTSGVLIIQSTLPVGKGMASSSADIVSSLRAVARYYGRAAVPSQMARWATQVEPSDGIMYPFVSAFDPVHGVLLERFGRAPVAWVVGVLGHGHINTEDHHRHSQRYSVRHQKMLREAVKAVREGLSLGDVTRLGKAGRLSAAVELERRPDDQVLSQVMALADQLGVGMMIAHSGPVRGLLLARATPRQVFDQIERKLWALNAGPVYRIRVGVPMMSAPMLKTAQDCR